MARIAVIALGVAVLAMGTSMVNAAPSYDYGQPTQGMQAQAADLKGQLKTAATHAGFAAGGTNISYTEQHLGHALNCIEGSKGKNYNQSWGNVCQGMGNGILVDLKAAQGGAALMPDVEKADTMAVAGVKTKNLEEAKKAAQGVADLLNGVLGKLK